MIAERRFVWNSVRCAPPRASVLARATHLPKGNTGRSRGAATRVAVTAIPRVSCPIRDRLPVRVVCGMHDRIPELTLQRRRGDVFQAFGGPVGVVGADVGLVHEVILPEAVGAEQGTRLVPPGGRERESA